MRDIEFVRMMEAAVGPEAAALSDSRLCAGCGEVMTTQRLCLDCFRIDLELERRRQAAAGCRAVVSGMGEPKLYRAKGIPPQQPRVQVAVKPFRFWRWRRWARKLDGWLVRKILGASAFHFACAGVLVPLGCYELVCVVRQMFEGM